MKKQQQAFPCLGDDGMELRDWFAGQALTGIASDPEVVMSKERIAEWCYEMADAMLEARSKSNANNPVPPNQC